jgi:hypothetical protein
MAAKASVSKAAKRRLRRHARTTQPSAVPDSKVRLRVAESLLTRVPLAHRRRCHLQHASVTATVLLCSRSFKRASGHTCSHLLLCPIMIGSRYRLRHWRCHRSSLPQSRHPRPLHCHRRPPMLTQHRHRQTRPAPEIQAYVGHASVWLHSACQLIPPDSSPPTVAGIVVARSRSQAEPAGMMIPVSQTKLSRVHSAR